MNPGNVSALQPRPKPSGKNETRGVWGPFGGKKIPAGILELERRPRIGVGTRVGTTSQSQEMPEIPRDESFPLQSHGRLLWNPQSRKTGILSHCARWIFSLWPLPSLLDFLSRSIPSFRAPIGPGQALKEEIGKVPIPKGEIPKKSSAHGPEKKQGKPRKKLGRKRADLDWNSQQKGTHGERSAPLDTQNS